MEITMNNQVYQFRFGMGFVKEINKKVCIPLDGAPDVKKNAGLRYTVAGMIDGDIEALIDILDAANMGCEPRVPRSMIESYIEDESTDIDRLFADTLDFLSKANCTKKAVQNILNAVEEMKKQK